MSLFGSIGKFMQSLATPQLPLYSNLPDTKQDIGRPPVYPAPSIQAYINAYNTNATIYTIISYISQKFGNVPRYMYLIEDEQAEKSLKWTLRTRDTKLKEIKKLSSKAYGEKPIKPDLTPAGKLAAITSRPNDSQGQDSYYAEAYLFYELTGEAFIRLNRGDTTDENNVMLDDDVVAKMPVLEKRVLPSQWVNPIPSKEDVNEILYYQFQDVPGHFINIRTVDMIHWKKSNPNYDGTNATHLRGMSTLSAGLRLLTQDNSSTDAAVAMQQNQGAKGLLFNKTVANPTPGQATEIRNVIDANINNTSVKGSVSFLGGADYGYLDMGRSSIDLELNQSQQTIFIRLCNLFGVPPAIFLTETTYENLQQAGKSLLTNKILPACCSFRDEENRVLLPSYGLDPTKYTTDIDATVISELAEDTAALAIQLANSPYLTFNEKREATGNERADDPNLDKYLVPNNLISLDDLMVNDGLNSFTGNSRAGNSNLPGGTEPGLHEQDNAQEGSPGASGNAAGKQS